MTTYADQNETSPTLGPASSDTAATFVGFWGPSGVTISADQNETPPSPRAANCETVATFEGSWEAQRSRVIRKKE